MWGILKPTRWRKVRLNRHWRAFFAALVGCAVAGALVVALAPGFAGLFLFGIFSIPSNSIIPVPHEPGVLYFAKFYHPVWIAAIGTIGTGIVCFADYAIVEAALRHPRIKGASEARLFRWAVRWMTRWPFAIVALFSFVPLPVYVVRVLAPASHYPVWRYVTAMMVGRFPRFLALAYIGHAVQIPTWVLVAMFVVLLAAFLLGGRAPADQEDEEREEDEVELEIPDLTDPEHPKVVA